MRRRPGIAGLQKDHQRKKKYEKVGTDLSISRAETMKVQLSDFQEKLAKFASEHKKKINKNPEFRKYFQEMCVTVDVDPLASQKGFWAELLGVGDFYYELGVQILEVCLQQREVNGGLIEIEELRVLLERKRNGPLGSTTSSSSREMSAADSKSGAKKQSRREKRREKREQISVDDIERAISKLSILGSGLRAIVVNKKKMIQCVATELNADHTLMLSVAQEHGGHLLASTFVNQAPYMWSEARFNAVINTLLQDGIVWIDYPPEYGGRIEYWFPSLCD